MKKTALITALLLAGCGQQPESPNWDGGLKGVWNPTGPIKGYMILHQGHDCFAGCRYDDSLIPAAEVFAKAGYVVYGFEMPPEPHDSGPIERFTDPVTKLLDTLPADGKPRYMAGLSGGGWTTTMVTALDGRITKGYSVASDPEHNDWEQSNMPYSYDSLWDTAGHRLTHIYTADPSSIDCSRFTARSLPCWVDKDNKGHSMSSYAVSYIIANMEGVTND